MRILVIGGTGFIGRHLVARLCADQHQIVVPTRLVARGRDLQLLPTVTLMQADVHDDAALDGLVRGCDAVINLVGILHGNTGRPYGSDFARAHVLLPDHHFLEAWDDYVPRTGVRALIQPVMTPVFNTKQTGDVLLSVARRGSATLPTAATTYYDYVRERWARDVHPAAGGGAPFEDWWRATLQTGFVAAEPAVAH